MREWYTLRIVERVALDGLEERGYHALEVCQGNRVFAPMGETLVPGEAVGADLETQRDPLPSLE
jgi:hypothetical protein